MMNKTKALLRPAWILLFIFIAGIVIRLIHVSGRNLWSDEASSFFAAFDYFNRTDKAVLWFLFSSQVYTFMLAVWFKILFLLKIVLPIEFLLRFPSVLFGSFSILLVYFISKALFDVKTALISAYLLAFSVFHLWYSQEARMYSLWVFLALTSILFLLKWVRNGEGRFFCIFMLFVFLSLWTNPIVFLLYIACPVLFIRSGSKQYFRKYFWGLTAIVLVLIGLFLYFNFFGLFIPRRIEEAFWILRPVKESILFTFENFNVGYNASKHLYLVSDCLFFSLMVLAIACSWKNFKENTIFILSLIFIPPVLLFIFSLKVFSAYLDRYLIFCLPFYFILLGRGLACIKNRLLFIASFSLTTIILLLALNAYQLNYIPFYLEKREDITYMHHQGVHLKPKTKEAAKFISKSLREGDIIIFENHAAKPAILYLGDFFVPEDNINHVSISYLDNFMSQSLVFNRLSMDRRSLSKLSIPVFHFLFYEDAENWEKYTVDVLSVHKNSKTGYLNKKTLEELPFDRLWLLSCDWNVKNVAYLNRLDKINKLFKGSGVVLKDVWKIEDVAVYLFERK